MLAEWTRRVLALQKGQALLDFLMFLTPRAENLLKTGQFPYPVLLVEAGPVVRALGLEAPALPTMPQLPPKAMASSRLLCPSQGCHVNPLVLLLYGPALS